MDVDESLERHGLQPVGPVLAQIRTLLAEQTARERAGQGDGDTELMHLHCVQLFSAGRLGDIELIWLAKRASMDAGASIDIQLLCGAGLSATLAHLRSVEAIWAREALEHLTACIESGDLDGFDVRQQLAEYRAYYESEE